MSAAIKKAVSRIFIYLLLTAGAYMFLVSCSNSYNRMSAEKITPASIVITGNKASVSVLDSSLTFRTEIFSPESRLYFAAYLLSSDDFRIISLAGSYIEELCF